MNILNIIGLLFNLVGVILLYFGFQTQKAKGVFMSGKPAISLKYENPLMRNLGWFFLIFGFISQLLAEFLVR